MIDLLRALHGDAPWMVVRSTSDQRAVATDDPMGFGFAFVHRPRGVWPQPGMTSLNVDLPRDGHGPLPYPPTMALMLPNRIAAIWVLREPIWPSGEFYRRQELLNVLLGTPQDKVGMSRLLPLPGNDEIPCEVIELKPDRIYSLTDFAL